jgi:hypothetical protein
MVHWGLKPHTAMVSRHGMWNGNTECCKTWSRWKPIWVLVIENLCRSMRNPSLFAASERWVASGFSSLRDEVSAASYVPAAIVIRMWFNPLLRLIRSGIVDSCRLSSLRHEGIAGSDILAMTAILIWTHSGVQRVGNSIIVKTTFATFAIIVCIS